MAKHTYTAVEPFSITLHKWLSGKGDKTLLALIQVFKEKSFAIIFLLMMAIPSLPLPTGGITHVTEAVAILVSLELIAGRTTIWLPNRWLKVNVGKFMSGKPVQKLLKLIEWFERRSRRRGAGILVMRPVLSLVGLVVLIFTVAAFVAPPFSGLDTLPSLGVLIISLGLILEDIVVLLAGVLVGIGGIALEIAAGTALYSGLTHFF